MDPTTAKIVAIANTAVATGPGLLSRMLCRRVEAARRIAETAVRISAAARGRMFAAPPASDATAYSERPMQGARRTARSPIIRMGPQPTNASQPRNAPTRASRASPTRHAGGSPPRAKGRTSRLRAPQENRSPFRDSAITSTWCRPGSTSLNETVAVQPDQRYSGRPKWAATSGRWPARRTSPRMEPSSHTSIRSTGA